MEDEPIRSHFTPDIARQILRILVSKEQEEDEVWWNDSKSGNYRAKPE